MKDHLRLLFVSNFYPPYDRGGYEKHCQEVATGLRTKGHSVVVLTSRYGVPAPNREGDVIRSLFLEADLEHYRPVRFFFGRRQEERYNVLTLTAALADVRPDIVVFWGMWNLSRRLPAAAEASAIPAAYWLGDLWPLESDMHTQYWTTPSTHHSTRIIKALPDAAARALLRLEGYPPPLRFRYVACGSRFLKRKLAAQIPAFQDATIVLCGVDLDLFADCQPHGGLFDPAAPRIIYVGGLGAHKGVHTAVEAIARLMGRAPELHPTLTIVGSGHPDYAARLRQLADSDDITAQIHFVGTVSKDQVPSLLDEHDILVVPSAWEEPFGRVVVEGMAAGLVVVGTATGGSAEILRDGANGLVFPPEDAPALAYCLNRLVQDRSLYARLAASGKQTSKEFDLQQMIAGMERFLFEVVPDGARGRSE